MLGFRIMPPDTEGDVGPNHYFEWINLVFKIYDKNGNPVYGPAPGNTFWAGFGGPCETDNDGDPIVLYDHLADRWFVQQFSTSSPYRLCAAVSTTGDPTGSYYRYEYVFTNNKFPDYPKVGLWPDAYYVGFNQFLNLSSWSGAGALAFERAAMIAGSPTAQVVYFDLFPVNSGFSNMFPADLDGTAPPAGQPGIFAEWDDATWLGDPTDTLRLWYFHVDWTNPANSTFGLSGQPNELIPTANIDPDMCGYNRNCIPQQGTTQKLDAIPGRLMYRIVFRDFGTYQALLTAQTVDADGTDHAGVHWRELRSLGAYTNYTVNQEGTYAPDANHRWMPSVNIDATGNICVAYSISSSSMYPSAAYACRETGDPPGTLGSEVIYQVGSGYQSGGNRWGDYSTLSVDPLDGCTFWAVEEYGRVSGSHFWSTAVAKFKMPTCFSGPHGTVHGTVTSSATGAPLALVQVQAVGTNTYSTTTNDSGQYSLALPPDTYNITFSKFGYNSFTQTGVVVTDGGDILLDVALNPVGNAELDGYVTGQAHGWPLYAKVVAKESGNEVASTFTNPFNGYYCFCAPNDLPQGYTYTLEVTPLISGYLPASDTVFLPPTGAIKNFVLADDGQAEWINCVLQGGLNENFDGSFPPPGWKVEVYNNYPNNNWRRNDQWGRANIVPGGSGFAAGADSDAAGNGSGEFDTALVTPYIQMPATTRELAFNHYFNRLYQTDRAYVDICVSPCSTWTNLVTFTNDNNLAQTISLAGYENQTIKLRFHYVSGDYAWYWYIDDVRTQVPAVPPPPPTQQWVENFDTATVPNLPANWAQVDVSGTAGNWATATATHHPPSNPPYTPPNLVWFNSWHATSGSTRLYKTTQDTIPPGQTGFVGFYMYHDTGFSGSQDRVQVQYSTDGVTWNNAGAPIQRYDGTTGWSYHQVELTGATGAVYVGLLGISAFGNDIHVDNVAFLLGQPGTPPIPDNPVLSCSPVAGALVEGFVTDANTGSPLVGATVSHDLGGSTTTVATPANPDLADGFYYLFTPLPGQGPSTRTFTASKTGYGNDVKQLNITPNTVQQLDFALPAGWLVINPTSLFSRRDLANPTETQTLNLDNQGGLPVNFQLFALPQPISWPHYSPVVSGSVPHTPASIGRAPSIQQPNYGNFAVPYLVSVEAYGIDVYPNSVLRYWPDLTVPGTATPVGPDTNWDFGGDFVLGDFSKLYVLDYSNNQLAYLDTSTAARTIVGPAVPSGGHVWTGMAASPTGTIYASATDCSTSTLYTIDKNTGAATLIGTITNTPCAINLAIDPAGQWLYAVDIVNDNLVRIDPSTAAGTVVGSLGANANFAQGLDFDDVNGTLYWAAYTGSGELRVIDTSTGAATLVGAFPGGAEIDALATKTFAGGVCWLSFNPDTSTVPANSTLPVDATFDINACSPPLWFGSHQAKIHVVHDSPYTVPDVSVCLYKAFSDVANTNVFDKYIHGLAGAKITQGFGGNFNPSSNITRSVMARWLLLARYGNTYSPPPCTGIFADVDCENTPNADWIEDLYNKGITSGCSASPLKFCPNDPVKRNQMSVFLLKAKAPDPTTYTPPPCTGIFADVTCPSTFANWIEDLYNQGITSGCGGGNFCPGAYVRREQMSTFVVKTFSIPTCP